ncbi:MAG: hypothetical protein ACXWEZ_04030 [Actinomycetota bacterium]
MSPARSLTRSFALPAILVVVAMSACSEGAAASDGIAQAPTPATTTTPSGPTGGGVSDGGKGEGAGSDGAGSDGGGSRSATTDDLQVFAFATGDEGQLAGEVAQVSDTVAHLASDAAARNLNAAQADAATLLDEARTLETDSDDAARRQQPLEPADPTLVKARGDAIAAFGLTATYAATVVDLADAALDLNLAELVSIAQQAASMQGTSAELEAGYEDLNRELTAWAHDHPAAAAEALARFDT